MCARVSVCVHVREIFVCLIYVFVCVFLFMRIFIGLCVCVFFIYLCISKRKALYTPKQKQQMAGRALTFK